MIDKFFTVSSMEKVFLNKEPLLRESKGSMLRNERFSFQAAVFSDRPHRSCSVVADGVLEKFINIRITENVPCVTVNYQPHDDYWLTSEPGLFPDVLRDLQDRTLVIPEKNWLSLYITVEGSALLPAGTHDIKLNILSDKGVLLGSCSYTLKVIGSFLPEHDLLITNWVHYDCIANQHKIKLFSKQFYDLFGDYLKKYTAAGNNMLFTPLFTPPLDTEPEAERGTAQLMGVGFKDGKYSFSFARLKKFIDFSQSRGIKYFEFSHLFTQWGAQFCPKIIVRTQNADEKKFGWQTKSDSPGYIEFLSAFLPALIKFLKKEKLLEQSFFHMSDEPGPEHIGHYEKLRGIVKPLISGCKIIDAVSDAEFCEKGLIDLPAADVNHAKPFYEKKLDHLVYYCCTAQDNYVSNRLLGMPLQRLRIIGMQMYCCAAKGFLHWGFNFYNSHLSKDNIDPYAVTDALYAFPGGDPFIVYPSKTGVYMSVRAETFKAAIEDHRALLLLESLIGKDRVLKLLQSEGIVSYTQYPRSAERHISFREKINSIIEKNREECL